MTPFSTSRPSLDGYFLGMLKLVASRSTCPRREVGAIITTAKGQLLSTGYNGVPSCIPHCIDFPCAGAQDTKGDSSRCEAVHAEVNAILQCLRIDLAAVMYCSCTPCFNCAKIILNTRTIRRIVCLEKYIDATGEILLNRAGVRVVYPVEHGAH